MDLDFWDVFFEGKGSSFIMHLLQHSLENRSLLTCILRDGSGFKNLETSCKMDLDFWDGF